MENKTYSISEQLLNRYARNWKGDEIGQRISSTITNCGLRPNFMRNDLISHLPFTFSEDVGLDDVTNQEKSLRCWIFASQNPVRKNISDTLKLKERNFQLSQNYTYFYDQLEKSNAFLNSIIYTANWEIENETLLSMLRKPISDSGQWHRFARLSDKYGVVPKYLMPDTECSFNTQYLTEVMSIKLRWCAKVLRDMAARRKGREQLITAKEDMLEALYGILCRFLGDPPKKFDFEYRDQDNCFFRISNLTPKAFYQKYGGVKSEDYIMVVHHPSEKRPFMQTYVILLPGEEVARGPQVLLNIDMPLIKQMVIEQLKNGEPVVMGCDAKKQSIKSAGYMDAGLYDYEGIFNTDMTLSKEDRILYKDISAKHIMTFTGVNLTEDGTPDRWKVHNSYGEKMGIRGHYVMSDNWFDQYVLNVVINKKYAPKEVIDAYNTDPIPLKESEFF